MLRTATYLIAALALIALGVGVQQRYFGANDGNPLDHTDQSGAATPPAISRMDSVTSHSDSPSDLRKSNNVIPGQSPESLSGEIHPSGPASTNPAVTPRQDSGSESQTPSSVNTEASDPAAVIGRPFPVSASVVAKCRSWSTKGGNEICDEVHRTLSEMAQEPRDPAWATDMEAKLRNLVLAQEPGDLSIRSIECRQSLCAVEVTSLIGPYCELHYDDLVKINMSNGLCIHGRETGPSGARVIVSLESFSRR
jgi:hypothetical protein